MKRNSLLLNCGLCIMTSFQRVRNRRGGVTLQERHLTNSTLVRWSRSTSTSHRDSTYPWWAVMRMVHISEWSSPQNILPESHHEKNIRPKHPTEEHAIIYTTGTLQNCQGHQKQSWETVTTKKSLRRHDWMYMVI